MVAGKREEAGVKALDSREQGLEEMG